MLQGAVSNPRAHCRAGRSRNPPCVQQTDPSRGAEIPELDVTFFVLDLRAGRWFFPRSSVFDASCLVPRLNGTVCEDMACCPDKRSDAALEGELCNISGADLGATAQGIKFERLQTGTGTQHPVQVPVATTCPVLLHCA
jgi:hypothetical protein